MEQGGNSMDKEEGGRKEEEEVFGGFLREKARCGNAEHKGCREHEDGPREGIAEARIRRHSPGGLVRGRWGLSLSCRRSIRITVVSRGRNTHGGQSLHLRAHLNMLCQLCRPFVLRHRSTNSDYL